MVNDVLERLLGGPVDLELLKAKPQRRTERATGPHGTAIVKRYRSGRAATVAARVAGLAEGPADPLVPHVLHVDADAGVVILTDVPGRPLTAAILGDHLATISRAGNSLASWHGGWKGRRPPALRAHTAERERTILDHRCADASAATRDGIRALLRSSGETGVTWTPRTVVHRDLYEEHILIGAQVGLIDLDDVAVGPPELDVGNLLAHLTLLGFRGGQSVELARAAFVSGYRAGPVPLDEDLLARCETLSLMRLACIHGIHELVRYAAERSAIDLSLAGAQSPGLPRVAPRPGAGVGARPG